jgi:hypothetical protein
MTVFLRSAAVSLLAASLAAGALGQGGNSPDSILDTLQRSEGVNEGRLVIVGGTLALSMTAIHLYQQNGWWKDNRTPFHFQEDLVYGLSVDKIGHFYGGYFLAFALQKSLAWANVPEQTSLYLASGGSLLFQTYVEIEDGFSTWGFDRVDFAADLAGSAWPIARYLLPTLRNFDFKMSYHPSDLLGNPGGIGFKGQKHLMIDDYEGQTFWMSVKVHNLLPDGAQPYWPEFLCLAAGYGARHVADPNPYRVWFVGLDVDMAKLIPPSTPFLKTLGEALNFIRLPLPAIQVAPGMVWYGVYF